VSAISVGDRQRPFAALNEPSHPQRTPLPFLKRHPEIWVAFVLFVGSNLFVNTFARLAQWQGEKYSSTADFCTWDCNWFRIVVDTGYDREPHTDVRHDHADWSFYPLFPLSALPLKYGLRLDTGLALVLTSRLELFAAILSFLLMVREHLRDISAYFAAGALVAFNPYVIYAHAGYSEPLYFSLAAASFYLLGRKHWIASGGAAALLSATRIVGCIFSLSYVIAILKDFGIRRILRERDLAPLLGLLLCPLGMAAYMLYLYVHTGDALGFIHIQIAWGRTAGNPVEVVLRALRQHHWQRLWGLMAIAGVLASGWLFKQRKPELAVFLLGAILLPLSADAWGFARYLWWQPPLLYAIFMFLNRHRNWWVFYFAYSSGMAAFMVVQWFSGSKMVI
jgi:hypothetical protein